MRSYARFCRIALAAFAWALFGMPSPAWANPGASLDLKTCVARALEESAALDAQEARYAAQTAHLDAARDQRFPSLAASGSYTRSSEVEGGQLTVGPNTVTLPSPLRDSTALRLQLQQPLYAGGRILAGIRAADALVRSSAAQTAQARTAAAGAAEKAYWNLYLAQEGEAASRENLRATESHTRDAALRLAQGAATRGEVLAWELRKVQAELAVGSAQTRRAQAAAALALLLGLPWDSPVSVQDPPELGNDASDLSLDASRMDERIRTALDTRPDLEDAAAQADVQDAVLDQARAGLKPSVSLAGSFSYLNPNPRAFPQREGFEPYWEIGAVASMDIGGIPGNLARVREAQENARAARLRVQAAERSARLEIVSTALAAQDAKARMEGSAKAVDLAAENLRVSEDRFAAGIALDSELADAEAALLAARLDRAGARVAWELSLAALRDASGGSAEASLSGGAR